MRSTGFQPIWLLAALVLLAAGCQRAAPGPAAEGTSFPPVNVRDAHDRPQPWTLPPGRLRVVNIWAVWCPPCRKEMPDLQRLDQRLRGEGIVVTTLVMEDDPRLVDEFRRRYRLSLPVARIDRTAVENRLGAYDYPLTLVVDAEGTIRLRLHGALDWSHPQVIEMLRDLAAGRRVDPARREQIIAAARSSFVQKMLKAREAS